jgi:hypothetical protein
MRYELGSVSWKPSTCNIVVIGVVVNVYCDRTSESTPAGLGRLWPVVLPLLLSCNLYPHELSNKIGELMHTALFTGCREIHGVKGISFCVPSYQRWGENDKAVYWPKSIHFWQFIDGIFVLVKAQRGLATTQASYVGINYNNTYNSNEAKDYII